MTHVKAREWIKPLAAGRGDPIDAGCKDTLQAVWDHVKWEIHRSPVDAKGQEKERPWVSAETLAAETGEKVSTIRDRLRKLTKAGWIKWENRAWSLAWSTPWAATPVARKVTRVACDSSHRRVRLQSPTGATPVTDGCDSSRTKLTHEPSKNEVIESTDTAHASEATPTPPDVKVDTPTTSAKPKARRKRSTPEQPSLPMPGTDSPAKPTTPAELVHERLVQRQTEVREALGMGPPGKSVLDAGRRAAINARISEHSLEACYRAIDVDAAECKQQGREGSSWAYWNLDTPFRNAKNFEQRLGKWRADGNHAVWGVQSAQAHAGQRMRGSSMPGQNERLRAAAEADNRGREQADAELQAQLEYLRANGKIPRLPEPVDAEGEVSF